ncbi:MAG: arsenate reductase [Giesbergeria sp.]
MKNHEVVLYGIPNCDTVRKARAWLADQGLDHHFHDFKKSGVPEGALARWLKALGQLALVNRRGTTWRQLDTAEQEAVVDDASATALLLAHPSAIRRPVVEWSDGTTTVGFAPADWALHYKNRPNA